MQVLARVRTERPTDVLTAYQRALDAAPQTRPLSYLYGLACLETGQLEAAGEALGAAQSGGIEAADRELGRLALRQRQPQQARDLLTRYLNAQPDDAGAHVELAKTYEALGDGAQARSRPTARAGARAAAGGAHYGYGILAGRAGQQGDGFYHLATAARLERRLRPALSASTCARSR